MSISSTQNFFIRISRLLTVVLLLVIASCTVPPPERFASNTATEEDLKGALLNDTVSINASTILIDTILTGNISFMQAGAYRHPQTGLVACTSYLAIRPNNVSDIEQVRDVDSLTLTMQVIRQTGDNTVPLTVDIYQLDTLFSYSRKYYSVMPGNPRYFRDKLIGTQTLRNVNATDRAFTVRLNLTNILGDLIKRNRDSISKDNPDKFAKIIKGIAIVPRSVGSVYTFSLADNLMRLNYRDFNDVRRSYFFGAGSGSTHFTTVSANRTGSLTAGINTTGDKLPASATANRITLQGSTGLRGLLTFPGLSNLGVQFKDNILLKAVLEMPADSLGMRTEGTFFNLPNQLFILESSDIERPSFFVYNDMSRATPNVGTLFSYSATRKMVSADITSYVYNILKGTKANKGLLLYLVNSDIYPNLLVLANDPANTARKMKLKLYYTPRP